MSEMNLPEFIALVAAQIKEASEKANERIRKTQDDPFLLLRDLQLQVAFTAEKSKATGGHLELKPWIFSAGGEHTRGQRNETVHTVTLNLSPIIPPSQRPAIVGVTDPSPPSWEDIGLIVYDADTIQSIMQSIPGSTERPDP